MVHFLLELGEETSVLTNPQMVAIGKAMDEEGEEEVSVVTENNQPTEGSPQVIADNSNNSAASSTPCLTSGNPDHNSEPGDFDHGPERQ